MTISFTIWAPGVPLILPAAPWCIYRQVKEEIYRGKKVIPSLIPKIRLEIAVNDEFVDITVDTIIRAAKSNGHATDNSVGDGKIFIQPLEECIRIRTEERGRSAI